MSARFIHTVLSLACCLVLLPTLSRAETPKEQKEVLQEIGIDQRLGKQVPMDLTFRNEAGAPVRLGDLFHGKPVVLSLVYFRCPMLCSQVLEGMVTGLRKIPFKMGHDFDVITVSFDPKDTPAGARAKKAEIVKEYGRPGATTGWHFLTGDQASIHALTKAVGFRYVYDPGSGQFAHAAGIMLLTPQGKLSRYFYGITYAPRDLRLGLVEASGDKIGSVVDEVLLACCQYDPQTGKYGVVIMNVIRIAGGLTVLLLGGLIWLLFRQGPKKPDPVVRQEIYN